MNMQIDSIILYNESGEIRQLKFNQGAVNIIAGTTNVGKSSIIPIIEYCLGSSEFRIPDGVIQEKVSWYAVLYQIGETQVFIAKPAPKEGKLRDRADYREVSGPKIKIPALEDLITNVNGAELRENLSHLIGMSLDQTIFYLFQGQDIIDKGDSLFYRQDKDKVKVIRSLTSLLVKEVQRETELQRQLAEAKRDKSLLGSKLRDAKRKKEERERRAKGLVDEAKHVGLIDQSFDSEDLPKIVDILRAILQLEYDTPTFIDDDSHIEQLREELNEIERGYRQKIYEKKEVDSFQQSAEGYSNEGGEQVRRLESIGLFDKPQETFLADFFPPDICPLCSSGLKQTPAKISSMISALRKLKGDLGIVQKQDTPRIQEYLRVLESQIGEIKNRINKKKKEINAALQEQEEKKGAGAFNQILEERARCERVKGQIEFFFRGYESIENISESEKELEKLKKQIGEYEEQKGLEGDENRIKRDSALISINSNIETWAKDLELEDSEQGYRFDLDSLTVVANRNRYGKSVLMKDMGGDNPLWCHLIVLLALHKYFVKEKSPVPNFLILDQPAQGYFVHKEDFEALEDNPAEEKTGDLKSIQKMFDLFFKICKELAPGFQLIVLEHANMEDENFKAALVEEYWTREGDKALIPQSWLGPQK